MKMNSINLQLDPDLIATKVNICEARNCIYIKEESADCKFKRIKLDENGMCAYKKGFSEKKEINKHNMFCNSVDCINNKNNDCVLEHIHIDDIHSCLNYHSCKKDDMV